MPISRALPIALIVSVALLATGCAPESAPPDGVLIDCADAKSREFQRDCILEAGERARLQDGILTFTIHHGDGSFHRFRFNERDVSITPADGADAISASVIGDGIIEFATPQSLYRVELAVLSTAGK